MHRAMHQVPFGAAIVLATTAIASAGYIEVVELGPDDFVYGDFASTGLMSQAVWIAGLDPTDALLAVFGNDDHPMWVQTSAPGGFYNASEYGQEHIFGHPDLYELHPELQWDTCLTLGGSADTTVTPAFPDTALAGGGGGIHGHDNLAWFDMDPDSPEVVGETGRILIGQFTTEIGYGLDMMQLGLNAMIRRGIGDVVREHYFIPAPGVLPALMLIGIGIGAGRRRG